MTLQFFFENMIDTILYFSIPNMFLAKTFWQLKAMGSSSSFKKNNNDPKKITIPVAKTNFASEAREKFSFPPFITIIKV